MGTSRSRDSRRQLPAVGRLLEHPGMARLVALYGRDQVRVQARRQIESLRQRLVGSSSADDVEEGVLVAQIADDLDRRLGDPLRRVLNATGIFLHTNLGRAPLPRAVAELLPGLLDAACDLELDLGSGRRGDRNRRSAELLCALTGAEAGLVVNNNAAALVLILATLARGREVVVSRGELVEIGGSFRVPEILEAAGARLVEVGSTNRTHRRDYEAALGSDSGLLLKVYPSNYRITGFAKEVPVEELAELGRRHGIPLVVDEGSGLLRPHPAPQLADHTSLSELLDKGVDLACGSGDKLLGGPQAGLLVGRRELVERCKEHPLYRALRPDRAAFASLEAVLRLHLASSPLPLHRLWVEPQEHRRRLEPLAARIGAEIVAADAFVGGGSAPEAPIAGEALALRGEASLLPILRSGSPAVVGYVREGRLILDLRTVDPRDDEALVAALERARQAEESG